MEFDTKFGVLIKAEQPIKYKILLPIKHKREFWTVPFQIESNANFKIYHVKPIPTATINDLDFAMAALPNDLISTINTLCRLWHGIKVWPVLFVRYESGNPLDESFKMFNAHLPVAHTIFLHNQPELKSNQTNPHFAGISLLAERILETNAKLIRGKSGLVLAEIYSLNHNVARFAPLSGSAWSPLPKFLQSKKAVLNIQNEDDRCFEYAIAAALHPPETTSNQNRLELYLQ